MPPSEHARSNSRGRLDARKRSLTDGDMSTWAALSPPARSTADAHVGSDSPPPAAANGGPVQLTTLHPVPQPRPFMAVAADGCRLRGTMHGFPEAQHKVLLIMGWSSCQAYWEGQTVGLGNAPPLPALGSFEVCCYDNRGTGLSDRPWGYYSTTMMAADAHAIMELIGWPQAGKKFHIVGHSMGGMIAQELALCLSSEGVAIDSLTMLASHSGGWRMSPPVTSVPRGLLVLSLCMLVPAETLLGLILPVLHTRQYLRQKVSKDGKRGDDVLRPLYRRRAPFAEPLMSYMPGLAGHTFACFTHKVNRVRLAKLARCDVRTLVVSAGSDRIIAPCHSMHLARALGCPFHKLEGCGHMAMTEQPGLFNAFLTAHLQDHLHIHPAGRAGRMSILGAGGIKHAWRLPFGYALQIFWLYPGLLLIRFGVLLIQVYLAVRRYGKPRPPPQPEPPAGVSQPHTHPAAKGDPEVDRLRRELEQMRGAHRRQEQELAELRARTAADATDLARVASDPE